MNRLSHTEAVYAELKHLKAHATKEELNKLVHTLVDPNRVESCIYGLMTGHCNSPRALELMEGLIPINGMFYYVILRDPDPDCDTSSDLMDDDYRNFTPLEQHIFDYPNDIKDIVAYLKGEIDVVELSR